MPEDYIHRAGRTARAGATGHVITFIAPEEEALVGEIQGELGMALPHAVLPDSVRRVGTVEKQPYGGRRSKRRDRRPAHGSSGQRQQVSLS